MNSFEKFLENFDLANPDWSQLPPNFPNCFEGEINSRNISKFNALKGMWQLAKPKTRPNSPNNPNSPNYSNNPNYPKSGPSRPGYEHLIDYMLGKVIQDLTVEFCDRWIDRKSRTHDQMVQAARSNPQNVAEGYTGTSLKNYIFLVGIANGSNEELAKDYQDFLRQRKFQIWPKDDPRVRAFRAFRVVWVSSTSPTPQTSPTNPTAPTSQTSPTTLNTPKLPTDPEEAANMLLTFCNLESFLLKKHISALKTKFEREGDFSEYLKQKRSAIIKKESMWKGKGWG